MTLPHLFRHVFAATLGVLLLVGSTHAVRAEETPLPNPQILIVTNFGEITLRLFRDKAPVTVENFLRYVDDEFYDGTIFHRVIPNFMIQGGGMTPDMQEKPTGDPIPNESRNRLHNIRGSIAMARTSDPDSATAQFFINQRSNLRLDWQPGGSGYAVFGEVIDGMNVVDFIATAPTHQVAGHGNVPVDPGIIKSIRRKRLF